MKKATLLFVIVILIISLLPGCDIIPENFGLDVNANINTSSELGPDTLERIDAVNETIANGFEVGAETRATIDDLNKTIANGVKAGFDDETLARVDDLLRVVEDGVKIGLDDDTLASLDGMVETIDQMPGNWEASAQDIIQTLENTAGSTAKTLADQVKGVMEEARTNYQQMTAITGVEFRCNVDFLGSKIGATAQEFIGKSIVGKIKAVLNAGLPSDSFPIPWVCQVIPDNISLTQVGERLLFDKGVVTLTGYNYVSENQPSAKIVDEMGNPVAGIQLHPYISSPYQIQLNLQELDFSQVPPRSRIVLSWPNVPDTSGIAILFPGNDAPVASFTMDKTFGNAPLAVQFTDTSSGSPSEWEWIFGDGSTSLEQNPTHTYTDSRDFQVQLTVKNSLGQSSVISSISVGTQLAANFSFQKNSGEAPLTVEFRDQSTGSPTAWLWDFGDNQTSTEQNPLHVYLNPKPQGYQVNLTVQRGNESSNKAATDLIKVMDVVVPQFKADKVSGKPPFDVKFTDQSVGGSSIIGWRWDFGDGTQPSIEKSPTHTYTKRGNFDVSLTLTRADGETFPVVKNSYINSFTLMVGLQPGMTIKPITIKDNSIYFTTFNNVASGIPLDTGISSDKYVCGVNGMAASHGVIWFTHADNDSLRIYLVPQPGQNNLTTWWIMADFQNIQLPNYYPHETWTVNVVCFSRTLENSTFVYRNDFRNINGGDNLNTGLKTADFFNCSVMGVAGLGATGFLNNTIFPIPLEVYLDGSGEEWVIHSDMDVHNGGDHWDVQVLCLKRNNLTNTENPPFRMDQVFFQTSTYSEFASSVPSSDYICGIGGYKAERGDIHVINPVNLLDPNNIINNMLTIKAFPKNGYWYVSADLASRNYPEDWTVNLLCVRKGIGVEGTPPN